MSPGEPMIDIVKPMRDLVYRLQSKLHRPTNKIPDDFKKSTLRQVGSILAWSFDTAYISPEDIRAGVDKNTVFVHNKLKELEELEEHVRVEREGLCLASATQGKYVVQKRVDFAKEPESAAAKAWKESNAAGTISSSVFRERKGQCAKLGVKDGDIPTLLECAKAGGDFDDIEELDLRGNELMDGGLQRLVIGLSMPSLLPKLSILRIGGNQYGPLGLEVLFGLRLLRKHVTFDEYWDGSVDVQASSTAVNDSSRDHENGETVGFLDALCESGSRAPKDSAYIDCIRLAQANVADVAMTEVACGNDAASHEIIDKNSADSPPHDASTDFHEENLGILLDMLD